MEFTHPSSSEPDVRFPLYIECRTGCLSRYREPAEQSWPGNLGGQILLNSIDAGLLLCRIAWAAMEVTVGF
jgi:hypothetical protein